MNSSAGDTRERIRWSARRHVRLLVIAAILGPIVAIGVGRESGKQQYRASALVVAKSLNLGQAQLPRFGEAVFASGAVADAVATDMGIRTPSSRLIPSKISVVPLPDTVLFEVRGTATNASDSARLANAAATAFVKELNKAGPGVGTFALQDAASSPDHPTSTAVAVPLLAVVGLLAGLLLGAGIVALRVSVRRPVVDERDAASIVGAPASVALTLGDEPVASYRQVSGLARLARTVFPTRMEQCAIVAAPGAQGASVSVAMLLAASVKAAHVQANGSAPVDARPLVVSAPPGTDLPDSLFTADRRILVVVKGTSERQLRELSRKFGPDEIDVVAFVSTRGRARKVKDEPEKPTPAPAPKPPSPLVGPLNVPAPPIWPRPGG